MDLETRTATPVAALGEAFPIRGIAIGPTTAAFLEANGRLSLWEMRSWEKVADLDSGSEAAFFPYQTQVAVSDDGNRIAVTAGDKVTVFGIDEATLKSRACALAGRPLSRAEWTSPAQSAVYQPVCGN